MDENEGMMLFACTGSPRVFLSSLLLISSHSISIDRPLQAMNAANAYDNAFIAVRTPEAKMKYKELEQERLREEVALYEICRNNPYYTGGENCETLLQYVLEFRREFKIL